MTLPEIIEQLKSCQYECEAGPLENNIAFKALEELAGTGHEQKRELLADYAHEAWSQWMVYMFGKGEFQGEPPTQTWTMPSWAVERWLRQMNTSYNELPESEKTSDRAEADKILKIINP